MITQYEELVQLRFYGERFAGHTLDIEATQELIAYKKLVLDCAKELWRRRNPGRSRLPRRFEEGFSLAFSELKDSSAIVPLMRRIEREDDELSLPVDDEFVQAARLVEDAIDSVGKGEPLPIDLPRNVIPLFRLFGKSLKADESLFVRSAGRDREAAYTASVRQKLANWTESTYEDLLSLTGEVSMANTRGGHFVLTLESGETPTGRFSPEQETFVLEALYRHRDVRLRVEGVAEFNEADRSLRGFVHVEKVEIVPAETIPYDETVRPIWEVLAEIGAKASSGAWDQLPSDLSMRVDEYLAGNRRKR
jgi:hypothetical protein